MSRNNREIGWSDSSDSDEGVDREEIHDASLAQNPRNPPGHRNARVPVIEFNHQFIDMNRGYWNQSLIAVIIDRREFSVRRMQAIINTFWRLAGIITLVGRDDNRYVLHFQRMEDLFLSGRSPFGSSFGASLLSFKSHVWEEDWLL